MEKQYKGKFLQFFYNEKGQDLVEYALLLAIIVGIGYAIFAYTGIAEHIKSIFSSATDILEKVYNIIPATWRT